MIRWMIAMLALVSAQTHAQSPYGYSYGYVASCVMATPEGRIEFTPGIPGCTESARKNLRDGEVVTYQMKVPAYTTAGRPQVQTQTTTMKVTRLKDRIASMTTAAGGSIDGATQAITVEFNPESSQPMSPIRELVTQRSGGKKETFVTYDLNLCARFQAAGDLRQMNELATLCAKNLSAYEDAVSEYAGRLAKQKMKLGLKPFAMGFSFPGYGPKDPPSPREARPGRTADLLQMIGECLARHGGYMMPPPVAPAPSGPDDGPESGTVPERKTPGPDEA